MKQTKLYIWTIGLLLGAMLLTACQREALLEEMGGSQAMVNGTDSCFINLQIINSSRNQTRAVEYEAASDEENAIYDGILAVFRGNSESTAVLESAVVIDQLINNPGSSTSIDVTQRLPIGTHPYPGSGNKLYVLALLNTSATGFYVKDNMLYHLNNATLESATLEGKTRGEIQALKINSVGNTDKHVGLFMASEPKQTDNTVLRQIYDPNWNINEECYLYDSEEAISQSASTKKQLTINVERAAARVKVTNIIPAAVPLSNITLVGATTTYPLIHQMTWALNKYNSGAFAVGGSGNNTGKPDNKYVAKDFTYFHQHSYQSDDAVYIGPNNNTDTDNTTDEDDKTEVIVEVQLKDGSFLLGDCFSFAWEPQKLYTSVEALTEYYKTGWEGETGQHHNYPPISGKTADEIFRNTKVTVDAEGHVTVNLTNSTFTPQEQKSLDDLANVLSGMTTCHRDGKMYYTYTLDEIVRNNAYNLSLVEEGETDTRHVVATFKFDQGTSGQTATFSNGTGSLFTSSVALGSNLNYYGKNEEFGQTLINPTAEHNSSAANETDYIDFQIDPEDGWTFTPSRISFNTTRFGTDGGKIDAYWLNSGGSTTELATGIIPYRNSHTPSVLNWSSNVTAGSEGDGVCGLRLKLHSLKENKQVGFSDIVIQGTLTKTVSLSEKKSISIVGRAAP